MAPSSLGTVDDQGAIQCPAGNANRACRRLQVTCDGIAPIDATLFVTEPQGAPEATVFLHSGVGGTKPYNEDGLVLHGFRTVSIAWATAWEDVGASEASIKRAACRPATAMKWIFDEVHAGRRDVGFCARGSSGGAGAVAYALAHYGLDEYLDFAQMLSGPPFARMDCGCQPAAPGCDGPTHYLCPELPEAPAAYKVGAGVIGQWENALQCGKGSVPESDLARLAADSVVSEGADYDYPSTPVGAWFCANETSNEVTGQGAYFVEKPSSPVSIRCVVNGCNVENVGAGTLPDGTAAYDAIRAEMETSCVPRHL